MTAGPPQGLQRGQPYRVLAPPESAWKPKDPVSPSWALITGILMVLWGVLSSASARGGEYWFWIIAGGLLAWYGYANRSDRDAPSKDKDPAGQRAWLTARMQARLAAACTPKPPARDFESQSERMLWDALQQAQVTVHQQQAVPNNYGAGYEYCADMAYYDPACGVRLDIEVDGAFKDEDSEIQTKMARRDRWFTSRGWHVLRFHANDAYHSGPDCARFIQHYIATATISHLEIIGTWGLGSDARPLAHRDREMEAVDGANAAVLAEATPSTPSTPLPPVASGRPPMHPAPIEAGRVRCVSCGHVNAATRRVCKSCRRPIMTSPSHRPLLLREEIADFGRVAQFVGWWLHHDPLVTELQGRTNRILFAEGCRPTRGMPHNPHAARPEVDNLEEWFIVKLFLDLQDIGSSSRQIFEGFIDDLMDASSDCLSTVGMIGVENGFDFERYVWEQEIEKIPECARQAFKANWFTDSVVSAEGRIFGWMYQSYFEVPYQPKARKGGHDATPDLDALPF